MSSTGGGAASLPIYMRKEIVRKRDSLDTLSSSDMGSIKDVGGALKDYSLMSPLPFTSFDESSFTEVGSQFSEIGISEPSTPSSYRPRSPGSGRESINPPQTFLDISPRFTESVRDTEASAPRH